MRLGLIGGGALVLALIGGLVLAAQVSAAAHAVSIGSATAAPGAEASVDLEALDISDPGLGAWTVDISYDTDVISVADCSPEQGGVCNPEFGDGVIRVTGASASGLEGDTVLATITFECGDAEGTSDLGLSVEVFADATIGDPQDIDMTVSGGSIECAEEEPTATQEVTGGPATGTGGAESGGGLGWLIAGLAAAGVAGVVGYGAMRLRARRS